MFTNSFDLNQSKAVLTQCFYRGVTRAASAEIKFSEGFLLRVHSWLVDSEICFSKPRGLLFLISGDDESNEPSSGPYYRGYLDYVRTLLSSDARATIPMGIREFEDEQIEMAAAIVQLTCRPHDTIGQKYVEYFLNQAESSDLRQQLNQRQEHEDRLLKNVKPYLLRHLKMVLAPKNRHLKEVLRKLISEFGSDDYKTLWLALIQKLDDRDPEVCDLFDGLISDESGLRNGEALKCQPYKFVYMDSIQSGARKGDEKYLTYARFRYYVRKIKTENDLSSVPT